MLVRALFLVLAFASSTPSTWAEEGPRRVALVVGNSSYPSSARLKNPANDSADVAARLRELGFEVELLKDTTMQRLGLAIEQFSMRATGADAALIYYAGHSFQFEEQNWLMPIDSSLETVFDARRTNLSLQDLMRELGGRAQTTLVFLDACRDNPLVDRFRERQRSSGRNYSPSRGLKRLEIETPETLLVYATRPNTIAADGEGRNSPFTTAFLAQLKDPGVEIEAMMKRVTSAVEKATKGAQTPERLSGLKREFYFRASRDEQSSSGSPHGKGSAGHQSVQFSAVRPSAIPSLLAPPSRVPIAPFRPDNPTIPPYAYQVKIPAQTGGQLALPSAQRSALLVEAPEDPNKVKLMVGAVTWKADSGQLRADIEVPEAKLKATMIMKKNDDPTIAASHVIEVRFAFGPDAPYAIKDLAPPEMRRDEMPNGDRLAAAVVPITSDYFLVGLARGDREASNLDLIRTRSWFDLPIQLKSGRVAKVTFEKGLTGEQALAQASAKW